MLTLFSGRHLMHVRRALALSLAVPLLLAGCSDDAKPTPKMPDSSSSSPTTEPTETETPEAESPEDFIRRWVQVDREMQNTGETDAYKDISSSCKTCISVAKRVAAIYEAGGFVKTDGLIVQRIVDQSGAEGPKTLDVTVRSSPTVYKESAAGEEQRLPGGTITYRMRLNAAAPWRLVQLTQLAT